MFSLFLWPLFSFLLPCSIHKSRALLSHLGLAPKLTFNQVEVSVVKLLFCLTLLLTLTSSGLMWASFTTFYGSLFYSWFVHFPPFLWLPFSFCILIDVHSSWTCIQKYDSDCTGNIRLHFWRVCGSWSQAGQAAAAFQQRMVYTFLNGWRNKKNIS